MSRKTRKLIWSAPLMAAIAVIGALALFVTLAPNGVQAHDVPGVVTDLNAQPAPDDPATPEVEGRTQIKLTWKAPTGTDMEITGYRIDRSEDGHVWNELVADTGTPAVLEHTDTVTGSKTGSTYFYRVLAINSSGIGPMSVIDDGTTKPLEAPDRPESVDVEANGPTEIVVQWSAPADDGGSPITKYRIHIDPPGDSVFPALTDMRVVNGTVNPNIIEGDVCEFSSNGSTFEYRHKSRLEQENYRYQIYAINDVGTSSGSATRGDTTDEKEQPDSPTDVLAVQMDATTVALYWNWPANNGGANPTGFRVEVTERSGQWPDSDSLAPEAAGATTSEPNLSIADNPGTEADEEVFNGAFTVLAAGNDVNAHEVIHTHGFNTLDGEDSTGVGQTLYYRVFTVTGDDSDGTSRSPSSVSVRLLGAKSATDTDINLPPALDATSVDADPPTSTEDLHGNYSRLTLEWDEPDDKPTSYRIDYSKDGIQWKRLERDTTLTRPGEYNDDELDPETTRHYRVFGKRGGQFRPAAKTATPGITGMAIVPDNVRVTATPLAPDKVQVRWDQPERDGGADVTHYQVQVSANGSADWTVAKWITVEKDPATCEPEQVGEWIHTMLLAETTRYYRVFAVNRVNMPTGDTPATTLVTVTVTDERSEPDADPATTPAASRPQGPIGLTAELAKDSRLKAAGKQGVLLVWNAPPEPPGSPVSSYRIERKVMGEDEDAWVELEAASTASETHYTDRDEPEAGEMRYYRVAATNRLTDDSEGVSDWSNVIRIPIAAHTTHPPAGATDLTEPTNVVATSTVARELTLTWEGAENAEYYILVAVDVAAYAAGDLVYETASVSDGAARTGMVSNLNSGTSYLGIVFAVKGTDADIELMHGVAAAAELVQ